MFAILVAASVFLWFKISFFKKRGGEKLREIDVQTLAQFVDDSELHGRIGTVDQIADGRLSGDERQI